MPVPAERILHSIHIFRDERVLLDADLAVLYRVETGALVRAVKRNPERFPSDFMFQLDQAEWELLRSHSGISSAWGGRRYPPYAFTEQGVGMLSSVLHSERAIAVNIEIMRTFTRLRAMLASHADLARKVEALERKYDGQFRVVFEAIRELMTPSVPAKKPIGFVPEDRPRGPKARQRTAKKR